MDEILEPPVYRCPACVVCGVCYLRPADGLVRACENCGAAACVNCSLPTMALDDRGRVVDRPTPGVVCSRCNPPTGGRNAFLGAPPAVPPTIFLVPA